MSKNFRVAQTPSECKSSYNRGNSNPFRRRTERLLERKVDRKDGPRPTDLLQLGVERDSQKWTDKEFQGIYQWGHTDSQEVEFRFSSYL